MTTAYDTQAAGKLAPTPGNERIAALDVIRGFALIGILLMNIEFFNRFTGDAGMGLQQGMTGANLWFSYFVQYFVTGKFWTIFSMLFGMGFAVMLTRAETAERSFLGPYLRRIVALAVFGVLHYILLWNGDILFGYATAAAGLLIALYGRLKYILLSMLAFAGLGAVPGMGWSLAVAGGIAFFGLLAWFLRCDDRITIFKRSIPIFKIVVGVMMTASVIAALFGLLAPDLARGARVMTVAMASVGLVLSILMARYHHPAAARPLRLGVGDARGGGGGALNLPHDVHARHDAAKPGKALAIGIAHAAEVERWLVVDADEPPGGGAVGSAPRHRHDAVLMQQARFVRALEGDGGKAFLGPIGVDARLDHLDLDRAFRLVVQLDRPVPLATVPETVFELVTNG